MLRALRLLLLFAVIAFVAGFAVFAERTTRHAPPRPAPSADALVALTGAGGARLSTAIDLLEQGAGARLLITGVNPSTTDDDVRALANGSTAKFDCCVDLDRSARSTIDNAHEVAAWTRSHGYRSLIVVTADFHMPRSILELRRALGADDVALHPYPVSVAEAAGRPWWRDVRATRRMVVEYVKFIAVATLDAANMRTAAPDGPPSGVG